MQSAKAGRNRFNLRRHSQSARMRLSSQQRKPSQNTMQQRGERHLERMAGVSKRAVDHVETMDGPEILNSLDEIEKLDKVARRTFGLNDVPLSGFSLNVLNLGSLQIGVPGDEKQE